MNYNLASQGDEVVVRLSESLMFDDHERFREVLDALSQTECKRCVIDLSQVPAVDSAGLGMLMIAYRETQRRRVDLVLRGPSGQVKRLLEITDLGKVVTIQ